MIKIIGFWNGAISGEFTSVIDLYYNLKNYIDVEFHLSVNKDLVSNCIQHLRQNNNSDLLSHITIEKEFESDIIICTSFIPYTDLSIKSKKLFILDTLDLVKNNYVLPKINSDDIVLLVNPANMTNKIPYKQVEYYHKFSSKRLNNLAKYYRPSLYVGKSEFLLSDVLDYTRVEKSHIEIKPGVYFENIGKRIFEHLYHKKIVNYSSHGATIKDGLFYYLKLFNIDAFMDSHNLKLSEQIIKEKLFMSEDDVLLNLIKEGLCQLK